MHFLLLILLVLIQTLHITSFSNIFGKNNLNQLKTQEIYGIHKPCLVPETRKTLKWKLLSHKAGDFTRSQQKELLFKALENSESRQKALSILLGWSDELFTGKEYALMMMAACQSNSFQSVQTILTELEMQGMSLDETLYHMALRVCCSRKHHHLGFFLLKDMVNKKLPLSPVNVQLVLHACLAKRDFHAIISTAEVLRDARMPPETSVYSTLIYAAVQGRYLNELWTLLSEAFQSKTAVSDKVLSSATMLFCTNGDWERAFKIVQSCRHCGQTPRDQMYLAVIKVCLDNERFGEAKILRAQMRAENSTTQENQSPNAVRMDGQVTTTAEVAIFKSSILTAVKRKELAKALGEYQDMKNRNLPPDIHIFNNLIALVCKSGEYETALKIYSDSKDHGFYLTRPIADPLISCIKDNRDWQQAVSLISDARRSSEQNYIRLTSYIYGQAIAACTTSDRLEEALELKSLMHKDLPLPRSEAEVKGWKVVYSSLVGLMIRKSSKAKLQEIFEELDEIGKKSNFDPMWVYTIALNACARKQRWKSALELLEYMEETSFQPTAHAYNIVINACDRAKQMNAALSVFEKMEKNNIKPDKYTFSSLISVCETGKQPLKGIQFYNDMTKVHGIEPDIVVYSTAINCFGSAGMWKEAIELLEEMYNKGFTLNVITYSCAIRACSLAGKWQEGLKLYQVLKANQIRPNTVLINQLLVGLAKVGRYKEIFDIFDEMHQIRVPPDFFSYKCGMIACELSKNYAGIIAMVRRMEKFYVKFDSCMFRLCLLAGCREEDSFTLNFVTERMLRYKHRADISSLAYLVPATAVLEGSVDVEHCLDSILNLGVDLDAAAYGHIIDACIKSNQIDLGLKVHEKMVDDGLLPNQRCLNALVLGYAQKQNIEKVSELIQEIGQKKLLKSPAALNAAICAYSIAGDWEKAHCLARILPKHKAVPLSETYTTVKRSVQELGAGESTLAVSLLEELGAQGAEMHQLQALSYFQGEEWAYSRRK